MAVNIAHCLERVLDSNPANIDISGGWIRDIHRQLAGEFFPDWAGRYRRQYFDALRQADCGDFAALNEVWMERLGA